MGPRLASLKMDSDRQTASETLRTAIQESGLSIRELGRRAGVEAAVLSRFMSQQVGISLATFEKLAPALGLRVIQVRRRQKTKTPTE